MKNVLYKKILQLKNFKYKKNHNFHQTKQKPLQIKIEQTHQRVGVVSAFSSNTPKTHTKNTHTHTPIRHLEFDSRKRHAAANALKFRPLGIRRCASEFFVGLECRLDINVLVLFAAYRLNIEWVLWWRWLFVCPLRALWWCPVVGIRGVCCGSRRRGGSRWDCSFEVMFLNGGKCRMYVTIFG